MHGGQPRAEHLQGRPPPLTARLQREEELLVGLVTVHCRLRLCQSVLACS